MPYAFSVCDENLRHPESSLYCATDREAARADVMQVDRKWLERNLGFDPVATPPPASTFAFSRAAKTSEPEDLRREIIDFDSDSLAGLRFLAFSASTGLSRFTDINWPPGLAPNPPYSPAHA